MNRSLSLLKPNFFNRGSMKIGSRCIGALSLTWWLSSSLLSPLMVIAADDGSLDLTEDKVRSILDDTQQFLVDGYAMVEDHTLDEAIASLQEEVAGLQTLRHQLERQEQAIERLVARANAKQVEGLIERLNATFSKERTLRKLKEQQQHAEVTDDEKTEYITRDELKEKLDTRSLLKETEDEVSKWALKLLQSELKQYEQQILAPLEEQGHVLTSTSSGGDVGCPSVTDVVQDLQVALNKFAQDGIGLLDHAQGGTIVHSMTSATYVVPPSDHELLGNVWWRKYIPEDWETWLPSGWENWNVGIPSYFHHTLGLSGAKTSPPETILEQKVLPGSCWPMGGNYGQVTIRLPYSIKVESFSLDHVSVDILPEDMHESAPKKLKVVAYPPCPVSDECGAMGFDFEDPMEVAQIEYLLDGSMVQTFDSIFVQAANTVTVAEGEVEEFATEGKDDDDDDDDDNNSCSTATAACSTPPQIDVAAVTVKILENYGNPDYTCMYRFRVHGEQVV